MQMTHTMGIAAALALAVAAVAAPAPVQPVERKALIGGMHQMYAPSVLAAEQAPGQFEPSVSARMWVGGWLTDADPNDYLAAVGRGQDLAAVPGADKIWFCDRVSDSWSRPQLAFVKTGFHVNDPSVLRPASDAQTTRDRWLYMYYTQLANGDAQRKAFDRHAIGLASSVDGGKTWTDRGVVIPPGAANGRGAWSPGAVAAGDEIWVYWHDVEGATFRQRLALDGLTRRGDPERLRFEKCGGPLSNLDVARCGDHFVMVANTLDLHNINRYVSKDGRVWYEDLPNPLIPGATNMVLTPHLHVPDGDSFAVYFGYDSGQGAQSIHAWAFAEPCAPLELGGERIERPGLVIVVLGAPVPPR